MRVTYLHACTWQERWTGVNRDNLITSYFLQGFSNAEIALFLALHHGIILSVLTVKRILKRLRLRRAKCNNGSPLEEIVSVTLEELENSCGSFMGYRQLTRHSRRKYNLQVTRDTVMKFLCIIDPEGVECRKRRRLKRQRYTSLQVPTFCGTLMVEIS